MKLNVKLLRNYRSKNGNVTFVYAVSGSKEALAAFAEIQGEYYREDADGTPLWFTVNCIGKRGSLIITENNKLVADMSEMDQAASLVAQYGGNFGQELARASARKILGGQEESEDEES